MSIKTDVIAVGVAGAVLLAAAWYAKKQISAAADVVLPAINPLDPHNLAYSGVNAIGASLTGDENFTLGGSIYDATHGGVLDWGGVVNPTSTNNVAYSGVNAIGGAISGQQGWSLGGWIYDVTH
jgi:hypothetical protein